MDNIINFEDYKKKHKGGFAPVTVEKQREEIEKQRQEIEKQREQIEKQRQEIEEQRQQILEMSNE